MPTLRHPTLLSALLLVGSIASAQSPTSDPHQPPAFDVVSVPTVNIVIDHIDRPSPN
jgi:hypothetical protein